MRYRNIILIALYVSLSSCEKEAEVKPKDYPYVITNSPKINSSGAEFSANLTNLSDQEILEYGFVWGENTRPSVHDNKRLYDNKPDKGVYSCTVNSGLAKGKTYYVRAYIRTDQYEIFGNEKSFKSKGSLPPVIESFSPQKGYSGESVAIKGKNFSTNMDNVVVRFGQEMGTIDSLSNNAIYVQSPLIKKSGNVKINVSVAGMETTSDNGYEVYYAWNQKASYPGIGNHSAAYFSINNYGYMIGGQEYDSDKFTNGPHCDNVWRYNPNDDSWKKMNDLPFTPLYRSGTFVIDNSGYVYSSTRDDKAIYKYNVDQDSWTKETEYPGNGFYFTAFVIDNVAYMGLGPDNTEIYDDFYKYNPSTKQWTQCADFPGASRFRATGFSINGKGYIALGQDIYNFYNDVWEYDPETDSWNQKNNFPGEKRSMSVSFSIKGKIYVGLGTREYNYDGYSDIWEYVPDSDTWQKMDAYIGQATWNNIVFTLNDKAYIGTGAKAYGGGSSWSIWKSHKDLWEFNPNLDELNE